MCTFPLTGRSPLTLTVSCPVLPNQPGRVVYSNRTIYVPSAVEAILRPSQPTFQSFTSVVCAP